MREIEHAPAVDGPSVGRLNVRRSRIAGGFTLIETIAAIVVLAVAIPPIIIGITDAHRRRSAPPLFERARWLAAERLEDVIADRHSSTRGYAYVTNANYPSETSITGFTG
ncbi:MAG: type II secretion system protein, partial [Phycisphaerae bacterium]